MKMIVAIITVYIIFARYKFKYLPYLCNFLNLAVAENS